MNESSNRFPLFDLDFQPLTYNVQLQKIPAGERAARINRPPLTLPVSLNIISIIRHHR